MELSLPMSYVELDQEEMMYLDGGRYTGIAIGVNFAAHLINAAIGYVAGKALAALGVVGVIASGFGIAKSTATNILKAVGLIGTYVFGFIGEYVARKLDRSGNGWIGIYLGGYWGAYTQ